MTKRPPLHCQIKTHTTTLETSGGGGGDGHGAVATFGPLLRLLNSPVLLYS